MNWPKINRRQALGLGATVATGLLTSARLNAKDDKQKGKKPKDNGSDADDNALFSQIEDIIQAQGSFNNGVYSIEVDRDDIQDVTLNGVPILPPFQLNGDLFFQEISENQWMMNGDMCLKPSEMDPFIDQLLAHDIIFQAEHQHFYDFSPMVFFIHFRRYGDPIQTAKGVKAALNVTSTPFPQTMPSNPTTPLPADQMGKILGASPEIGSDGVVTYYVPRKEDIELGDVEISPYLNVATQIVFEPLNGGSSAAAAPDFGMIASEIQTVIGIMRHQGWDIGCLYNQETDEEPQLYFSHNFKTGDPIQLAREIRNGLNHMNVKFL